jgi:hypothetical protein
MRVSKTIETFNPSAATPNVSSFTVGGGVAGVITTVIFVVIGLIGLPTARWFLLGSVCLGGLIALGLRVAHRRS